MKTQFDWQVGEPEDEEGAPALAIPSRRSGEWVWFLLISVAIVGLLVGSWQVGQAQIARSERNLMQRAQQLLYLEHEAFLRGDGELFFSVQTDDPAWMSAQLLPENQEVSRASLRITRAQSHGEHVWANVAWTSGHETWQRIAFFEWQDGRLVHVPSDGNYWGQRYRDDTSWGELVYQQVDAPWRDDLDAFVGRLVSSLCDAGCLEARRPFVVQLAPDYGQTAVPGQIRLPSPRLVALTEDGRPAPQFWQQLQQRIEAHLTPATIRFALPPSAQLQLSNYQRAAVEFMAANPGIIIELVSLETLPDDMRTIAADFDGAAITPSAAMVAAGLVGDLTDYARTDPDFDRADFYEQVWQGAQWRQRMWYMPQSARLSLLFYDKEAYRHATLAEPSLRWTWEEMARDVATLVASQPEDTDLSWGFVDLGKDTLFSFAYNWKNSCGEAAAVHCQKALKPEAVAAAYDWIREMTAGPALMPDLAGLSASQRETAMLSWQSSRRRVAIWVEDPVSFEHYLLLDPLGVATFPGSDRFDGITPLWVSGSFISQQSQRPLAVWQWLKFLSYQRPARRLIPARPSIALATGYWSILPRPLGNAMRTAFPFARPVTLAERDYFPWEQLVAVLAGELSPNEAAQQGNEVKWFVVEADS